MIESSLVPLGITLLIYLSSVLIQKKEVTFALAVSLIGVGYLARPDLMELVIANVGETELSLFLVTLIIVLAYQKLTTSLYATWMMFFLLPIVLYLISTTEVVFLGLMTTCLLVVGEINRAKVTSGYDLRVSIGALVCLKLHILFFCLATNSVDYVHFNVLVEAFYSVSIGFFVAYAAIVGVMFYNPNDEGQEGLVNKIIVYPALWIKIIFIGQILWFELAPVIQEQLFQLFFSSLALILSFISYRILATSRFQVYLNLLFGFYVIRLLFLVIYDQTYLSQTAIVVMITLMAINMVLLNERFFCLENSHYSQAVRTLALLSFIGVPLTIGFTGHSSLFTAFSRETLKLGEIYILLLTVLVCAKGFQFFGPFKTWSTCPLLPKGRETLPSQLLMIICVIISSYLL